MREIKEDERKVDQQRRGIAGTGVRAHDLWTQRGRFKEGCVDSWSGGRTHMASVTSHFDSEVHHCDIRHVGRYKTRGDASIAETDVDTERELLKGGQMGLHSGERAG